MLYTAYEWQRRIAAPARTTSALTARALEGLPAPLAALPGPRRVRALCQIVAGGPPPPARPDGGIDSVPVDGVMTEVYQRPALSPPFAPVLHFTKPAVSD